MQHKPQQVKHVELQARRRPVTLEDSDGSSYSEGSNSIVERIMYGDVLLSSVVGCFSGQGTCIVCARCGLALC